MQLLGGSLFFLSCTAVENTDCETFFEYCPPYNFMSCEELKLNLVYKLISSPWKPLFVSDDGTISNMSLLDRLQN